MVAERTVVVGKRIAITGASSGIGAALARELHGRGAKLFLIARREVLLKKLAGELGAEFLVADLTNENDRKMVSDWLVTHEIDWLVNNAGRGSYGRFAELPLDQELAQVRLNIEAPLILSRALLPHLLTRNSGGIVTVSSILGYAPLPFMATYSATKAFERSWGRALSEELRGTGVRHLVVCPGPTATDFFGVARVPGTVTSASRDPVERVAYEIACAMEGIAPEVRTGVRGKLFGNLLRVTPWQLSLSVARRLFRGVLVRKP